MMYTAKIENINGDVLLLTGRENEYQVINIEGLNPPNAQINLTTIVNLDGAMFNSAKLDTRNIVLTVKINGDVEKNRLQLYKHFRTKEWCRFFYTNGSRDVFIDGYVDTVECGLFSNAESAQISILCPYPFFKSLSEITAEITDTLGLFVFPFAINYDEPVPFSELLQEEATSILNDSESEGGITITMTILDPVSRIEVKNTTTGEDFVLAYSFLANDRVTVNTQKGEKSVRLLRGNEQSNIFGAVQAGSKFIQIAPGVNTFEYRVDNGTANADVLVTVSFRNVYRGV